MLYRTDNGWEPVTAFRDTDKLHHLADEVASR